MINQANPVGAFLQGRGMAQQQQAQQQQMDLQRRQFGMQETQFNQGQQDRERQQQLELLGEIRAAGSWVLSDPEQAPQRLVEVQNTFRPIFGDMVDSVTLEALPGLVAQAQQEFANNLPANVREWEYFNRLPEDEQQEYLNLRRGAYSFDDVEGGDGVKRPSRRNRNTGEYEIFDGQRWVVAGGSQQQVPQNQTQQQQVPPGAQPPPPQRVAIVPSNENLFGGRSAEAEAEAVTRAERQTQADIEREALDVPGRRALDAAFAPEATAWVNGAYEDTLGQLQLLEGVRDQLRSGQNLTGPVLGNLPRGIRNFTNPGSVAAQDSVEQVVQRNLRVILGAQFTENEGQRLIARAYNPALDEAENLRRLDLLITQIGEAAAAKNEAVSYFMQNGTLSGFQGGSILQPGGFLREFERRVEGGGNNQPRREQPQSGAPEVGAVQDGYRFKGGDPADPNSWERI